MKFLLVAINAKYIHSNLAVYSLKAYYEKYGRGDIQVDIAEYTINQYSDEILQDIYERRPDAIGFSCYIWNISMIKDIAADYKKICKNTDIWVGGPEVSYNIKELLDNSPYIDYVMYGEGEEIFKNVLDAYGYGSIDEDKLKGIKGVGYRDNREVVINDPQPVIDLSTVPFVYKDMGQFANKIVYYETSRGCPFSCSYCLSSIDKRMRFRNPDLIKEELQFFLDNRVSQVKFVDRTFNCNPNHAMAIWKYIQENDNGFTNFHFEIAADIMTGEEIELIQPMRPGLIQLEIGVQSTNPDTLAQINRRTDIDKIANIVSQIKKKGNIHQHLDLIAGLPYENLESFKESFNRVYSMKPDQLQLGFLKVLHGSAMKERAKDLDIIYSANPPYEVLSTHWLGYEEILKLKYIEAVVEIYYNSFQFSYTISELEKIFDSPFQMYEKLGLFYKQNSLNGEKHSRVDRYQLLLDFIKDQNIKSEKWTELLTYDFYLRENAKKRPEFAKDIEHDKDKVRQFYKSTKAREILKDYTSYDSRQMERMTHVEKFSIEGHRPSYILFDYKNRNPLNKQAGTIDITEWIKD